MLVEVVDLLLSDGRLHDDRRQRVEAALVDLPRQRARRDVENAGQAPHEVVPALLGHVSDPELDGGAGDVRHDHSPTAVEDRPAWCLDLDQPELVRLRGVQVLVAGEHLERPEPEEQDDEDGQREGAEDRDAQRQLRREAMWLAHARIGREEATRRRPLLLIRPGRH